MLVALFRSVFSPEFWLLTLLLSAVCVMGLPAQDEHPVSRAQGQLCTGGASGTLLCAGKGAAMCQSIASDPQATTQATVTDQGVVVGATGSPSVATEPLVGVDEHSLRDIMTLRGEQENLFAGTVFEEMALPADDGAFLNALRKVAYDAQRDAHSDSSVSGSPAPGPAQLDDLELIEQLRQTSRLLDSRAADREATADYQRADQLRSLARRLRRQARQLAQ